MQETKLKLLERIVDRRQDSLYRFAYIRTGSQADAEDIVQDVLLRLFHSDCNLDRIDDVERYLWRAIANLRLPDFRPDRRDHRHHRGDRQIPFPLRDRQAPQTHQPLKIIRHEMHRF